MARQEKIITIESENRDKGKQFKIVEMSALQAERFATKIILAIANSGAEIEGNDTQGIEALQLLQKIGLAGIMKLKYDQAEPLLEDLISCCSFVDKKTKTSVSLNSSNVDSIIEEISTLFKIRFEAFGLVFGFLGLGGGLDSILNKVKWPSKPTKI